MTLHQDFISRQDQQQSIPKYLAWLSMNSQNLLDQSPHACKGGLQLQRVMGGNNLLYFQSNSTTISWNAKTPPSVGLVDPSLSLGIMSFQGCITHRIAPLSPSWTSVALCVLKEQNKVSHFPQINTTHNKEINMHNNNNR